MKKRKTQAEIIAHEAAKLYRRNFKKEITEAKNLIKTIITTKGLRVAEMQLSYIKNNKTPLPQFKLIPPDVILASYQLAIEEYKETLML